MQTRATRTGELQYCVVSEDREREGLWLYLSAVRSDASPCFRHCFPSLQRTRDEIRVGSAFLSIGTVVVSIGTVSCQFVEFSIEFSVERRYGTISCQ